jgi:copper chaperone CopZ
MKTIITAVLLLVSGIALGQDWPVVKIKTSAVCAHCEERIEGKLNYMKGVKSATLDLKTKEVEVQYNPLKVSESDIRTAIVHLGYDADDQHRNEKAYAKLPKCCQGGTCSHDHNH